MLFKPSYFLVCDLFWSDFLLCQKIGNIWSSNIKSRIRPLALHPMLALHPPPVKGKFPGISLSLGIVVDQGMPRTRGHLGGPQIMGWTA